METKEIQKLIDFIAQSPLDEVSIETSELKISVKRYGKAPKVEQVHVAPVQQIVAAPVQSAPQSVVSAPVVSAPPAMASNRVTIKAPMIGTFYRSSNPEAPSLVEIGTEITKGKPVCIIEAMKLFNEIESEIAGKVVEVLVENATPVEFDQPLFVVELS
ncbi:MAG: acetyl-CoA carboxylase biotin carboxyl carrier protein [Pseudarcicella sp.]|nr:acetyl-CoA carboxylase biotin carboxyl carrier protein [Pseudarcicella sp.]MBP6410009.1 acetyl-CoA carboxylase biotin carboxyl carrier protein [Pseudarcicella sp.]